MEAAKIEGGVVGERLEGESRWYLVQTYATFEGSVLTSLKERARAQGLEDALLEVEVPTEEVVEIRRGRKTQGRRKFFPGYVLVRVAMVRGEGGRKEMDGRVWGLVKETPKVTGFVSSSGRPTALSEEEAERIFRRVKEGVERPRPSVTFEVGEHVRVADGPFASFNGVVEDVDVERARLKVSVTIFGRATPVDLEYGQVEKV